MGFKRVIRKAAKLVLASSPEKFVNVEVAQVSVGSLLKDKTIVVTGGGRGIGLAMAEKFVSEGAKVVISGRKEATLKSACEKLGVAASYVVADVSEVERASEFLDACEAKFGGRIDCLVSNAGVSLHENRFDNVTIEGFDKQFGINMRGAYFLCREFLCRKSREKEPSGELLVITSETGEQAYDIPYGMTKAAMDSFVRAASRRMYSLGVRVNAVAPGVTLSDMTRDYAEASDGNMYRECASSRIFRPEEVAEVACFLLSDASKCISGEIIHTNGGNHIKAFWDLSCDG